jgi:hypothetical protein
MTKPINVEAQRIVKVLEDTILDVQALQVLTTDAFGAISRSNVELEAL